MLHAYTVSRVPHFVTCVCVVGSASSDRARVCASGRAVLLHVTASVVLSVQEGLESLCVDTASPSSSPDECMPVQECVFDGSHSARSVCVVRLVASLPLPPSASLVLCFGVVSVCGEFVVECVRA